MSRVRPPTRDEAVEVVLRTITLNERRKLLLYWEEKYGESFVSMVKKEVERQWKKRS